MLERPVVAAIARTLETPGAAAALAEEAYVAFSACVKEGAAKRLAVGGAETFSQRVAHVMGTDKGVLTHFADHSMVHEMPGSLKLLVKDGTKLHLRDAGFEMALPNNTVITQEGRLVATKLPSGRVITQERISDNEVRMAIDGEPVKLNYSNVDVGEGVQVSGEKHATSVWLPDHTTVEHSVYGYNVYRGAVSDMWAGGQADVTVSGKINKMARLVLHNPSEHNMFASEMAHGSAHSGLAFRVDELTAKSLGLPSTPSLPAGRWITAADLAH